MNYALMHKDIRVTHLGHDNETGSIRKIDEICIEAYLPVDITVKNDMADRAALNEWWIDHSIPASRLGIRKVLEMLNLRSAKMLLAKFVGLSLPNQYQIRPQNSGVTWERADFFGNGFLRISFPWPMYRKKTSFGMSFFNDVCLRQMMSLALMMTACA